MTQKWKWSLSEALCIIGETYADDWGRALTKRQNFLSNPKISKIDDAHITGLMSGEGQPVIFIHGSPANAMRWSQYLENVPDGYQFISVDRMGFGDRGHRQPDLEKDFEYLAAFAQKYTNPVILGHSLGGALAVRLAARQAVQGLVLIAASIDPALERVLAVQKLAVHPLISWGLSRSIDHSNKEMFQLQKFMQATEKDLMKVQSPVHIVHAQDDCLVPFAHTDYARRYFQKLEVSFPETGGHSIPWNSPELILKAIKCVAADRKMAA